MENNNIFLTAKAAIVGACAAYVAAFGYVGVLCAVWVACMAADWISGTAAATATGSWSSKTARDGVWHKAGMIVVVVVAAVADTVLHVLVNNMPGVTFTMPTLVLPVVLCWYIFTELGSMAENAAQMGAPVPEWLINMLAAGKKAVEKSAETFTVNVSKNADGSPVGHLDATQLDEMTTEDLEQLAIDMGLTVKDSTARADLIAQIAAVPLNVPEDEK